ncbi:hypothetical protein V492_06611 [Pseudogymnoascus sp. VKM F-4246]|nr:hypothetical protein V492_06611 [Pseudogymnoascus sp. VKM F-4246]
MTPSEASQPSSLSFILAFQWFNHFISTSARDALLLPWHKADSEKPEVRSLGPRYGTPSEMNCDGNTGSLFFTTQAFKDIEINTVNIILILKTTELIDSIVPDLQNHIQCDMMPLLAMSSQRQQAGISTHTQRRQDHNHLPTRPKLLLIHPIIPHLTEELPVPDPAPIGADKHYGHAINSKESADAVEFGCEDLEDNKGEGKLRDGCANVGALKGTLSGADLDEPGRRVRKESAGSDGMGELLLGGEDDGAGTVQKVKLRLAESTAHMKHGVVGSQPS